jgi:hypothetical protein
MAAISIPPNPKGFFPHKYYAFIGPLQGQGNSSAIGRSKPAQFISKKDSELFKLYFDERLTSTQVRGIHEPVCFPQVFLSHGTLMLHVLFSKPTPGQLKIL